MIKQCGLVNKSIQIMTVKIMIPQQEKDKT